MIKSEHNTVRWCQITDDSLLHKRTNGGISGKPHRFTEQQGKKDLRDYRAQQSHYIEVETEVPKDYVTSQGHI